MENILWENFIGEEYREITYWEITGQILLGKLWKKVLLENN